MQDRLDNVRKAKTIRGDYFVFFSGVPICVRLHHRAGGQAACSDTVGLSGVVLPGTSKTGLFCRIEADVQGHVNSHDRSHAHLTPMRIRT